MQNYVFTESLVSWLLSCYNFFLNEFFFVGAFLVECVLLSEFFFLKYVMAL